MRPKVREPRYAASASMMDRPRIGHNRPDPQQRREPIVVELDGQLRGFVIANCEANISYGMGMLQMVHDGKADFSDDAIRKVVDNIENFRKLKKLAEGGGS